ncbi:hypothetical protein [Halovenus salina]|uniref:Uncharacterized protein n=1 Tax=Halovenus salina TaxID=1510225 RepID=A0ABD5W369_9EURY|nr:hypothetical protein [Halovenus salina]
MSEDAPFIDFSDTGIREYTDDYYVAWVDLMGVQSIMSRSMEQTAIDILSLHATAEQARDPENIKLYPLQDGFYAISESQSAIKGFLGNVFEMLSTESIETYSRFKYVIRGAIAHGELIEVSELPEEINPEFIDSPFPKSALLIGVPVIQAVESESEAPPFGIYVHESARGIYPEDEESPLEFKWWRWYEHRDIDSREIHSSLEDYYNWCKQNSEKIDYDIDDLERHKRMAKQYLTPPH